MKSTCIVYIILPIIATFAIITLIPVQAVNQITVSLSYSPTSGPAPLPVNLSVNLAGIKYKSIEWSFGDGTPHDKSNHTSISHTYQTSGNFTGTVEVFAKDLTHGSQTFFVNVGA